MTRKQSFGSRGDYRVQITSQLGLALCAVVAFSSVGQVWAGLECAGFASGGLVNTRLTAVAGTPFVGTTAGAQLVVEYGPLPCLLADSDVVVPGDLDGDGDVDAADLAILLGSWGPCPQQTGCPADLNGDGVVNAADLAIALGNWG